MLRVCGKKGNEKKDIKLNYPTERYVLKYLDRQIEIYENEKKGYEKEFGKLAHKHTEIRDQISLPGIGVINAVKIISRVVTPYRFANKGHYLSYCGLIKLDKVSGGRSYGKKNPRYCRQLKCVYKSGVLAAVGNNNPINGYYEHLIKERGYPAYNARHKAARRLAILSLGIFKSKRKYQPYKKDCLESNKMN